MSTTPRAVNLADAMSMDLSQLRAIRDEMRKRNSRQARGMASVTSDDGEENPPLALRQQDGVLNIDLDEALSIEDINRWLRSHGMKPFRQFVTLKALQQFSLEQLTDRFGDRDAAVMVFNHVGRDDLRKCYPRAASGVRRSQRDDSHPQAVLEVEQPACPNSAPRSPVVAAASNGTSSTISYPGVCQLYRSVSPGARRVVSPVGRSVRSPHWSGATPTACPRSTLGAGVATWRAIPLATPVAEGHRPGPVSATMARSGSTPSIARTPVAVARVVPVGSVPAGAVVGRTFYPAARRVVSPNRTTRKITTYPLGSAKNAATSTVSRGISINEISKAADTVESSGTVATRRASAASDVDAEQTSTTRVGGHSGFRATPSMSMLLGDDFASRALTVGEALAGLKQDDLHW